MTTAKLLKQYLTDYRDWVSAGAPVENKFGFQTGQALCDNLWDWRRTRGDDMTTHVLHKTLNDAFRHDGLDTSYPFNPDAAYTVVGGDSFEVEGADGTHHQNKERMEWVNKWIEKLEDVEYVDRTFR